jgi:Asp-tRNA(Asn)/Glu-tRNA(Gln) amidotransferase C subunit
LSWLTILRLLLSVADKIADVVRAQQLLSAGEDRQIAKQLAGIAERLEISEALDAERNAMSVDQIKDSLREDAR